MDPQDRQIIALLVEDGRRTYDDIGKQVSLSAPAVKRRVDRLRARGALRGFTAVVDHAALGENTEALVELLYAPGTLLDAVTEHATPPPRGRRGVERPASADAIARVRTQSNADLERLIMDLQRDGISSGRARRWSCRTWCPARAAILGPRFRSSTGAVPRGIHAARGGRDPPAGHGCRHVPWNVERSETHT